MTIRSRWLVGLVVIQGCSAAVTGSDGGADTGGGSGGSSSAGGSADGGGSSGGGSAGGSSEIIDAGPDECGVIDTGFVECTDACSLKKQAIAGYPMYSFNHRGCAIASDFETGTHACPVICTRPTQADRGTNATFTGSVPFMPGPALSARIPNLGSGQVLTVNINSAQLQAACVSSNSGLFFQLMGPADGGLVLPGSYTVSGTGAGSAGVLLNTTALPAVALGGTVTLSSINPVTATFDLSGFSRDAGGRLEGAFTATPCP